jgi:hypothetical protein
LSSHWDQIGQIIEIVISLKPRGILDIGPGRGKYGVLFCEYLREWAEQDVIVDAVANEPIWCRHAYHEVYRGDALEVLPHLTKNYNLVTIIDVIEHLKVEDGQKLLRLAAGRGEKILLTTPKDASKCGEHKSEWAPGMVGKALMTVRYRTYEHPRAWIMLIDGELRLKP